MYLVFREGNWDRFPCSRRWKPKTWTVPGKVTERFSVSTKRFCVFPWHSRCIRFSG